MRLVVTTPISVILDEVDVSYVRAEDETGAFGILRGHADFLTVLSVSMITFRKHDEQERYVVVRGGVLTVRDGELVEVATRQAVGEDTLRQLGEAVLEQFRDEYESEAKSRESVTRLHLAAIRQIQRYLNAGHQPVPQGPLSLSATSATIDQTVDEGGVR
jgi:F-type H+-transporting ATPase subunit epsilon